MVYCFKMFVILLKIFPLITLILVTSVTCIPIRVKHEARIYTLSEVENKLHGSDNIFFEIKPWTYLIRNKFFKTKINRTVVKNPEGGSNILSNLCPRSTITSSTRYNNETRSCGLAGTKSMCGENMIFYSLENDKIDGQCDCDYDQGVPLVYHPSTKRCYFVYQQGYCRPGEWIELNPLNGKPSCSQNTCYESGRTQFGAPPLASRDMKPEYVPLNGGGEDCVLLDQWDNSCEHDEIVGFGKWPASSNVFPKCTINKPEISSKTLSVPSVKCAPGSFRTILGYCQITFDFDFD